LAEVIWHMNVETVPKAKEVMDWLRDLVDVIMQHKKAERPVIWWRTPSRFQAVQDYRIEEQVRVKTTLTSIKLKRNSSYMAPTDEVDSNKHRNSITANVVHSLDAAAMTLT